MQLQIIMYLQEDVYIELTEFVQKFYDGYEVILIVLPFELVHKQIGTF